MSSPHECKKITATQDETKAKIVQNDSEIALEFKCQKVDIKLGEPITN